jgi:hypothetical protein
VTFTGPLDPATVGSTSLLVLEGGVSVPGSVDLPSDGQGRTIRWVGDESLSPDTTYRARVALEVRSATGKALVGSREFTFTTVPPQGVPLPDASSIRFTHSLHAGRRSHTATLLPGGDVLVAGGFVVGTDVTERAETWDPGTEAWTLLPAEMQDARGQHTATRLLDGRVLLAGGWSDEVPGELTALQTAELYDPATQTFVPVGNMAVPRAFHAAVLLPDGRVLVTGGARIVDGVREDLSSIEIFDPAVLAFLPGGDLVVARSEHGMALDGRSRVVIAGGNANDLRYERYDVASGLSTPLAVAVADVARLFGATVTAFASGGVSVAGGDAVGAVTYVDPDSGFVANPGSPLCRPRAYATATRYGPDRILVVGGADLSMGFFLQNSADVVIDDGVQSRTFCTEIQFITPLVLHAAAVLVDGRILFCGGLNPNGGEPELREAYVFTPP